MTAPAMRSAMAGSDGAEFLRQRLAARLAAAEAYFGANSARIAACASAMADRFFDGATLIVLGTGAHATDAQHNSVEYVHPVLPGCRALPALSLSNDAATVTAILEGADPAEIHARQLRVLARRGDIALAFGRIELPAGIVRGLQVAAELGMLTVALIEAGGGSTAGADQGGAPAIDSLADHVLLARTDDPLVAQELHLATYHMLWELVHIVLNHRGIPTEVDG